MMDKKDKTFEQKRREYWIKELTEVDNRTSLFRQEKIMVDKQLEVDKLLMEIMKIKDTPSVFVASGNSDIHIVIKKVEKILKLRELEV